MIDKRVLLSKLRPYVGSLTVVKYDQGTGDIINELLKAHKDEIKEYDKIYPYFLGGNDYETAKNIFDFLKRNIKYKIEPGSKQTLKSAAGILAQGYGDCKHYSQIAGGILDAINRNTGKKINWAYRFASYNDKKQVQHVFVVIKEKNGNEIWIDPVLNKFDLKKPYNYKIDKKPMALYRISGVENEAEVGKFLPGLKKLSLKNIAKAGKKVAKGVAKIAPIVVKAAAVAVPGASAALAVKAAAVKTAASKVKAVKKGTAVVKKVKAVKAAVKTPAPISKGAEKAGLKKVVVKVDNATSRNAFLTLVKNNKGGLGTKLGARLSSLEPKLKSKWERLGGKYNTLKSTILGGSRVAVSGFDNNYSQSYGIGAVDSAKIYAAALPTIKQLEPELLAVGVNLSDLVTKGSQEAMNQVTDKLAVDTKGQLINDPTAPDTETSQAPVIEPNPQGERLEAIETSVTANDGTAVVDIREQGSKDYQKFILPAAAIAAVYLIMKK